MRPALRMCRTIGPCRSIDHNGSHVEIYPYDHVEHSPPHTESNADYASSTKERGCIEMCWSNAGHRKEDV